MLRSTTAKNSLKQCNRAFFIKRFVNAMASTATANKAKRLVFNNHYRQFLKAGDAAVDGVNKKHIKSLIRQGFENKKYLTDPEIDVKVKNTLMLLNNASLRNGIEHDIVHNLCQLKYFKDKDDIRPPLYNRKMSPPVKELHNKSRKELELVIDMLNEDLKLCLM